LVRTFMEHRWFESRTWDSYSSEKS